MDGGGGWNKVVTMDSWSDFAIIIVFWFFECSQNNIITLHGGWINLVKGEGSIYRPRVGGMDGQDFKMMRW